MFWFLVPIIGGIVGWLFSVWAELPNEMKKKIIEIIISSLVEIFKAYYKYYKSKTF
jgi:hypothetical protein